MAPGQGKKEFLTDLMLSRAGRKKIMWQHAYIVNIKDSSILNLKVLGDYAESRTLDDTYIYHAIEQVGREGWQLCAVDPSEKSHRGTVYYFKRQMESNES